MIRMRLPELMDQPGLAVDAHRQALAGLRRIHRVSRTSPRLWSELFQFVRELSGRPLRVLDLACGGGDVLIGCAELARQAGLPGEFHGCDKSETAVACAREAAQGAALENISFSRCDVLSDPLPVGHDIVMSTLFLHHLADDTAAQLLQRMAETAGRALLVDDLLRSRLGWGAAWLGCRLLTRSQVVHADGPISVRAAFTLKEVRKLSDRAGLTGAAIVRHWPARFLLRWNKP